MKKISMSKDEYSVLVDEVLTFLAKENEQKLPTDIPLDDRRWLIDSLMLIRTMGCLDIKFISLQDRLLSYENNLNPIIDADTLKYKKNISHFHGDFISLSADMLTVISDSLFARFDSDETSLDNRLVLRAGLELYEDYFSEWRSDYAKVHYDKPYITDGYNTQYDHIAKIVFRLDPVSNAVDETSLVKAFENLFVQARELNLHSIAVQISESLSKNIYDKISIAVQSELEKINKKYKIKLIYISDDK